MRARTGVGVVAGIAASLWAFSPAASTQDEEVHCADPVVETASIALDDRDHVLYRQGMDKPTDRTYPLASPIQAGSYVANGASWDSFIGRALLPAQPEETWFAQLLDDEDNVLATTEPSPDLADGVDTATWAGELGEIHWEGEAATQVRFVHTLSTDLTPNSVTPLCLGLSGSVSILQVTTTTVAPTTTTTMPPTTTTALVEPEVVRPEFTG